MEDMNSNDTRKIYQSLLLDRSCVRNRVACNHRCLECDYNQNLLELDSAIGHVLDILKSRDPELYFCNDLEMLKEKMEERK